MYEISNFAVVNNKAKFRVVRHPHMINFLPVIVVKKLNDADYDIPLHRFQFLQFEDAHSCCNNDEQLSGNKANIEP